MKLPWKSILKVMGYAALIAMNIFTLEILYFKNELIGFKGAMIIFATIIWADKLYQCILENIGDRDVKRN